MDHGGLEALAQCQELIVRALTARAAQYRDSAVAIQQRCQAVEIPLRRCHDRRRRQQTRDLGRRRIGCGLQRDITRHYHHRHAALADRLADRDLQRMRHLVGAGDQFAIVAALAEQMLRVGFLEIPRTDLGRRDLRGDCEHRHARSVTIEKGH